MIARELGEFFAGFQAGEASSRRPVVQSAGDPTFLSNVNACYARACWEQIRFREVAYSEDQAFGSDMLEAGWSKVYHPGAAVLHAHDYGQLEFMRRYFDEYRGLRETNGHVEPFASRRRGPPRGSRSRGGPALDGRTGHRRRYAGPLDGAARSPTTAAGASSRRSARAPSGFPRRCDAGSRWRAATRRPASIRRRRSLRERARIGWCHPTGSDTLTTGRQPPSCRQSNT